MKTLTDLKRDIKIGDSLVLVEAPNMPNHKYLNLPRYIVKIQTNAICLNEDKEAKSGSYMDLPNAKLIEYDGETIKIFEPQNRPMTTEEKYIFDNMPSKRPENAERVANDMLSDGSSMYYADKKYLKDNGMEYLSGGETIRGLYQNSDNTIRDEHLKGQLILSYKLN